MEINKMLKEAYKLANKWKFFIKIDNEEIKEMTYLEMGILITTIRENIKVIHIKTSD